MGKSACEWQGQCPGSYVGFNEIPELAFTLVLPQEDTARGRLAATLLNAPISVTAGGSSPPVPAPSEPFQSARWRRQPKMGSFNQLFLWFLLLKCFLSSTASPELSTRVSFFPHSYFYVFILFVWILGKFSLLFKINWFYVFGCIESQLQYLGSLLHCGTLVGHGLSGCGLGAQ